MFHVLGRGPAREGPRHRGDRRQDLAAEQGEGEPPLHLVSAWASRQRLVLGQEATADKSNEIKAIPQLLARLELEGALVTIDAMGCQTEIARAIRAKGADYLLALKDNWPVLAEEVRLHFDTAPPGTLAFHETTDGDHGRIEVRRAFVSHDIGWLASDRRFPGEWNFPSLAMLGVIEAVATRDGKTSVSRRTISPPPGSPLPPSLPPSAPTGVSRTASDFGDGRRLPRRPHAPQDRQRTGQHGHHPPRSPQHRQGDTRQGKPQGPPKDPRVGRRLPSRSPHPLTPMNFKRFPCLPPQGR